MKDQAELIQEAGVDLQELRDMHSDTYRLGLDIALWLIDRHALAQKVIDEAGRIYPGGVVDAYNKLAAWERVNPMPGSGGHG